MSFHSPLADQMHELAVEISDFLGECTTLHPFGDEVYELSDLQALAQAFGDYLCVDDSERYLVRWVGHTRDRLRAIQSWSEVVDAQRAVQEMLDKEGSA